MNKNGIFTLISTIFSIAVIYGTFITPRLIHRFLLKFIPDVAPWTTNIEEIMNALRPYGYAALITLAGLIILGLVIGKYNVSLLGPLAMQLSIFGYFAFTMFIFAGIGVLRLIWLPLIDISPQILKLGHVVLTPI
ncbi:MAG: hypothetical protein DRJ26_03050, partial [Candidatus Methanomethylicota archaeon]